MSIPSFPFQAADTREHRYNAEADSGQWQNAKQHIPEHEPVGCDAPQADHDRDKSYNYVQHVCSFH
jgi:hypothetical protein